MGQTFVFNLKIKNKNAQSLVSPIEFHHYLHHLFFNALRRAFG